jgi:AcrR family transcriptional regulator
MEKSRGKRGRPRGFDLLEVQAATTEVFWEKGYAGASLDDLASAADVARPSLYAALGDKRTMYLGMLQRSEERVAEAVEALLAPSLPLRAGMLAVYQRAIDFYVLGDAPKGCPAICTAPAEAFEDPEVRAALARYLARLDQIFQKRFAIALSAKEMPQGADPVALGALASAAMQSLSLRARAGVSRADLIAFAAASVALLAPDQDASFFQ